MSLVTIEKNKQQIKNKLVEVEKLARENNPHDFNCYIMSQCISKQYEWVRDQLMGKYVKARCYDLNIKNQELLNNFYGYMYMHNYIAIMDEIYEVKDAQNKYIKNYLNVITSTTYNEENIEKLRLSSLLVIEELIDVFHFILQYTTTLQEHQLAMLYLNEHDDFNADMLYNWVTNKDDIAKEVMPHLERVGNHVDVINLADQYAVCDNKTYYEILNNIKTFDDMQHAFNRCMDLLIETNRKFIRETNFKGWKEYSTDYYNVAKFTKLYSYVLTMYNILLNYAIPFYSFAFENFTNDDLENSAKTYLRTIKNKKGSNTYLSYDINSIMKFVYAIYLAKRDENIRRQTEDARYKLNNTGEAVGIEVK